MSNCTGCRALEINNGRCRLGHKVGRKIIDGYKVTHPLETCSKPRTDAQLAQALEVGSD